MFKKKAASPYAIPAEVQTVIAAGEAAFAARRAAEEALQRRMVELEAAEQVAAAALQELERIDGELALAIDQETAAPLEKAANTARRRHSEAAGGAERITRMIAAIHNKAQEADEAVAAARAELDAVCSTFHKDIVAAYDADVRAAAEALVSALKRGYAMRAVLGGKVSFGMFLDEVNVPSVIWRDPAVISGNRAHTGSGPVDMASSWVEDPDAAAVANTLRPLGDMRRRLERHTRFDPANPFPAPPDMREHEAFLAWAIAEYNAPPPPPKPSRGLWQSWTLGGRWSHQDTPPADLNITPSIMPDETDYRPYQTAQT